MIQEPITDLEHWFMQCVGNAPVMEPRFSQSELNAAIRLIQPDSEESELTVPVRKYYDLGLIGKMPDSDHENFEIVLVKKLDFNQKKLPSYFAFCVREGLMDVLNITKTLRIWLPDFNRKIVPTTSELLELIEMGIDELEKGSDICTRVWGED